MITQNQTNGIPGQVPHCISVTNGSDQPWQSCDYARSLIESVLDGLITISPSGKITDMNEKFVHMTGTMRKLLTGSNFVDYFVETQKARDVYREIFAKGFVVDYPLTLRNNEGNLTDVIFSGSVYKDALGKVMGVVVIGKDITNKKIYENELIKAKNIAERASRKAEESTKLKDAFLANMSHEIRTPLNAIIGFSDLLSKRNLGEQEKEYVKTIKSAGENLLAIINDILDISKIEARMMTFEENNFSVRDNFKLLHEILAVKAKEKNLELLFTCDNSVPDVLLGDHIRLNQIIMNLAGNAIKFTNKGSVHVNANVLKTENENIILEFSITDTGIGIRQEHLEHIFERFRQAGSRTARKYGGTGLGLSIAKQLVELQGGTLSVKSEYKVGSVFSFSIPHKKSINGLPLPEVAEKKYDIKELRKLNILLAEDNQLNVKLIQSLFSEYGLKLQVAEYGNICIDKLIENDFDIILMDMEMPVLNGYETTTIIRNELKNNIPIIAMTAHAITGEREKCLSSGINDYISKPVNAHQLFEKIYNLTRHHNPIIISEPSMNNENVCDFKYITELMGGKKHLLKGIMDAFLSQIPDDLNSINHAVAKTDYTVIKNLTHSMKSSVSIMGIVSLVPILQEMFDLGTKAGDIEKIKELNHTLNSICRHAILEIEREKLNHA